MTGPLANPTLLHQIADGRRWFRETRGTTSLEARLELAPRLVRAFLDVGNASGCEGDPRRKAPKAELRSLLASVLEASPRVSLRRQRVAEHKAQVAQQHPDGRDDLLICNPDVRLRQEDVKNRIDEALVAPRLHLELSQKRRHAAPGLTLDGRDTTDRCSDRRFAVLGAALAVKLEVRCDVPSCVLVTSKQHQVDGLHPAQIASLERLAGNRKAYVCVGESGIRVDQTEVENRANACRVGPVAADAGVRLLVHPAQMRLRLIELPASACENPRIQW